MKKIGVVFYGGGGGVECAMLPDIEPVISVEYDPSSPELSKAMADNHEINFPDCKVVRITVQEYAALGFPGCPRSPYLLHASPVCSNFSVAKLGSVETSEDLSGAAATAQGIKELKPYHFSLENVAGYEYSDSFKVIRRTLKECGYKYYFVVIDCADYGLPQSRKRLFLFASLGTPLAMPATSSPVGWYAAIGDRLWEMPEHTALKSQWKRVEEYSHTVPSFAYLVQRVGIRQTNKIRSHNEPCWTITRSFFDDHKGGGRDVVMNIFINTVEGYKIKKITAQEVAYTFCGFPRWYRFNCRPLVTGTIAGYAVPPSVLRQWYSQSA